MSFRRSDSMKYLNLGKTSDELDVIRERALSYCDAMTDLIVDEYGKADPKTIEEISIELSAIFHALNIMLLERVFSGEYRKNTKKEMLKVISEHIVRLETLIDETE